MSSFFKLIQNLSLDIVFGAVILLHFFSKGVEIPIHSYFALGITVWLIYTFDHLNDSTVAKKGGRDRYIFHKKYKSILKFLMIGLGSSLLYFVAMLPISIIGWGSLLSIFCLLYVLLQKRISLLGLKEAYVAVVYSLGILIVPFVTRGVFDIYSFTSLSVIAFLNLCLFSWFEEKEDLDDGFSSIATRLGYNRVEKLLILIIGLGLAFATSVFEPGHQTFYFISVFMIYSFLVLKREWVHSHERYRWIGDGVFIFPLVFDLF